MNYQELVNKCKQAYKENDLASAYEFWKKIYDMLDEKLSQFDINYDKQRYKCYEEFNMYINQFDNQEVYDITDYGKQKAYKQMELERTYNILDKSVKCIELDNNEVMKSLDDFRSFYEWCILKSETEKDKYNIYDLQTNEIIDNDENNGNKTLCETILRLVDKALDYELNEKEFETDEEYNKYYESDYIQDLLSIQEDYIYERKNELEKQVKYEEEKLKCCAYGKNDLYYIESLYDEIDELQERLDEM